MICTDKTGTLTEGRMVVHRFWADGEELEPGGRSTVPQPFSGLLRTAVRCSNAALSPSEDGWERTGDPSEIALLAAAAELGEDILGAQRERGQRRRKLYHFDSRLKRMTTADEETDGGLWYHAKGAPLELLERCSRVRGLEGDRDLTIRDRETVRHAFEDYAGRGMRVLGFAERRSGTGEPDEDRIAAESGLTFLGLATLEDPPRPDVEEAVGRCREAGIRIIVITGDHGLTAGAVARRVGIVRGEPRMVSGPEIGIAMGSSGTEVAREAATMVLTDDSFSSIVAAIEEGRVVYDNIRKFVIYIFAHATPKVVPFLIYALSGGAVPLPLTVMQILAIDLGTETLPALALGREPAEPGIMRRPPRPREKGIMDRQMLTRAWGWLGLVEAALVVCGFFYVMGAAGWMPGDPTGPGSPLHAAYLTATTMTFAGITACQIGTAFAARTSRASLREIGIFSNKLLLWGVLFELVFAAAVIYLPPLQHVFGTRALGAPELAILAAFPFVVWGTDELRRWAFRRKSLVEAGRIRQS